MHCVFVYKIQNRLRTMTKIGELKTHHIANPQKTYAMHEFGLFGLCDKTLTFCICR